MYDALTVASVSFGLVIVGAAMFALGFERGANAARSSSSKPRAPPPTFGGICMSEWRVTAQYQSDVGPSLTVEGLLGVRFGVTPDDPVILRHFAVGQPCTITVAPFDAAHAAIARARSKAPCA